MNIIITQCGYICNHIFNAFRYACIKLVIVLLMSIMLQYAIKPLVSKHTVEEISKNTGSFENIKHESTFYIWNQVFSFAALEEFIFRFIPLGLIWGIGVRKRIIPCIVIAVSALIFGYLHGNWLNIFIQGVSGALLGIWFWRFMEEREDHETVPLKAWYFVSLIHTFFNLIIFYIMLFKK